MLGCLIVGGHMAAMRQSMMDQNDRYEKKSCLHITEAVINDLQSKIKNMIINSEENPNY